MPIKYKFGSFVIIFSKFRLEKKPMAEIKDQNTAYLFVGCIAQKETEDFISQLTARAVTDLKLVNASTFLINMPVDREGVKQSYCYIWWDNAQVRNHILEKYPTGVCEFNGSPYAMTVSCCTCELPKNPRLNLSALTTNHPLPNWVTEDDLSKLFSRFNVAGYFSCRLTGKPGEKYPLIRYDRNSHNAVFALLLRKIVRLDKGDQTTLLFFKYAQNKK